MRTVVVALLLVVLLAGCQYLKPALAPVDCAKGVVDAKDLVPATAAVAAPKPAAAPVTEKSRDGIPVKTVTEGDLVSFPNLKATDPDGDKLSYTFSSPLNASGMWQTKIGDAGEYKILITASDGKASTKQDIIIKVLAGNHAPTIEAADVKVKEGEQVTLAPKIADADNDKVTTSYSGWMTTNVKKTSYSDAGVHDVTITADDGHANTTKTITVTVEDVNRAPTIAPMQDLALKEGDKVQLLPRISDPDGDKLTVTYSAPFDANGVWQTKKGDEGVKHVTVTVTDAKGATAGISFIVAVESANSAPTISGPESVNAKEGDTVNLASLYTVTDADKDPVTITYSGWMTSATKQLGYDDAGSHDVVITASDKVNDPVKKTITVVVADANRPPTFDSGSFS
ncbi:MAG TPA: Ig-like domain-containing protein [Candidatus Binatia bacterium]|nr:Ig-like domain-containing protein [Candidatus Binatia bacterium]